MLHHSIDQFSLQLVASVLRVAVFWVRDQKQYQKYQIKYKKTTSIYTCSPEEGMVQGESDTNVDCCQNVRNDKCEVVL